jgi:hypothetical protein
LSLCLRSIPDSFEKKNKNSLNRRFADSGASELFPARLLPVLSFPTSASNRGKVEIFFSSPTLRGVPPVAGDAENNRFRARTALGNDFEKKNKNYLNRRFADAGASQYSEKAV